MEYLRTDTVSVGTLYRKDAKLSRGAGAYFCKHFVPAGAQGGGRLPTLPLRCSQGGLPSLPPAYPAFSLLSFPHPPAPLPGGKGETKSLFRRGLRPRHPCIRPVAALTASAMRAPRGRTHGSSQKRQEAILYEQCRQPRRGGTGGDGTIRRKRRRRLRWSSPPGQGWQTTKKARPRRREKNFKNPVFPLVKKAKMVYNRV